MVQDLVDGIKNFLSYNNVWKKCANILINIQFLLGNVNDIELIELIELDKDICYHYNFAW